MKTKFLLILLTLGVFIATSCKKDSKDSAKKTESTITPTQLDTISKNISAIYAKINVFMSEALSEAAQHGQIITQPPASAKTNMSKILLNMKSGDDWFGPDADGWYYKSSPEGIYKFTEKFRCKDSTMTYILTIESSKDDSYSCVYETEYTRHTKNKKVLYEGYADMHIKTFGNNNISDVEWKFEFTDWDPKTGAGNYNWYWGASSLGGNPVPYHRFLNIIATANNSLFVTEGQTLHVKVTWYDGSIELGSFEYDTDWKPVEMPEMPCGDQNNGLGLSN